MIDDKDLEAILNECKGFKLNFTLGEFIVWANTKDALYDKIDMDWCKGKTPSECMISEGVMAVEEYFL